MEDSDRLSEMEAHERFGENLGGLAKAAVKSIFLISGGMYLLYQIGKGLTSPDYTQNIKGVVFNEKYTPAVSKGIGGYEGSKYSFSIDSGKCVVEVKEGSSHSLEDISASIKNGSEVEFPVNEEDFGKNKYTVSADKILVK